MFAARDANAALPAARGVCCNTPVGAGTPGEALWDHPVTVTAASSTRQVQHSATTVITTQRYMITVACRPTRSCEPPSPPPCQGSHGDTLGCQMVLPVCLPCPTSSRASSKPVVDACEEALARQAHWQHHMTPPPPWGQAAGHGAVLSSQLPSNPP